MAETILDIKAGDKVFIEGFDGINNFPIGSMFMDIDSITEDGQSVEINGISHPIQVKITGKLTETSNRLNQVQQISVIKNKGEVPSQIIDHAMFTKVDKPNPAISGVLPMYRRVIKWANEKKIDSLHTQQV